MYIQVHMASVSRLLIIVCCQQALQDDITTHKGQLEALTAVGRALQDVTSPKDAMATSEQLAAACTAFEALTAAAKTRRQVLEDARLQVSHMWPVALVS